MMQPHRVWQLAGVALLAALSACDPVRFYRVPALARRGTDVQSKYVVTAAPNVSYSVGFTWFAGQLCASGEIHNGTAETIIFKPDRFFFQDLSGSRYLPGNPNGGGKRLEHPVDVAPGQSFKLDQWSEGGPATDGSSGARIRPEGRRLLFEQHGIVVSGKVAPVTLSLELEDRP